MKRILSAFAVLLLLLLPVTTAHSASVEGRLLQSLKLPEAPLDVAISPDGQLLFVLLEHNLQLYSIQGEFLGEYPLNQPVRHIVAHSPNLVLLYGGDSNQIDYLLVDVRQHIDTGGAPVRGPETAPVSIVVFDDFQCPYCAQLEPLLAQALRLYPDQVKLVFKNFPLNMHPFARPAALAALAAGRQGKFWEFHDQLFANSSQLSQAKIEEIAKELKLDLAQFKKDLADPDLAARIDRDIRDGQEAGVRGTPAVFINGRALQDRSLNGLRGLIEAELKGQN